MQRRELIKGALAAGAAVGIVPAFAKADQAGMGMMEKCPQPECSAGTHPPIKKTVHVIKITEGHPFSDSHHVQLTLGGHPYTLLKTYKFGDHYIIQQPLEGRVDVVRNGELDEFWASKWIRPMDKCEPEWEENVVLYCEEWTGPNEWTIYKFVLEEAC